MHFLNGLIPAFIAILALGSSQNSSESISEKILIFRKRPEVAHVDCARLIRGDIEYTKEVSKHRPTLKPVDSDWSCSAIEERILPARNPDTGFPILYARIVNENYDFLEDQLATNYANENIYCFAVDKKASKTFHDRFIQLEKCLSNVFVTKTERDMDSGGHNQNQAHLDCMNMTRGRRWEYAVLMQNHDVLIKTHGEMTEILKIYGGANDVGSNVCPDHRCISSLEKNLGKLKLCPKNLTEAERIKCESTDIEWGKGDMQAMISRAAVDFILDEIDVHPFIKQMNNMGYGVDEQLYNSININPEIRLPGGFHYKCRDHSQAITRTCQWSAGYYGMWRIWRLIVFIFTSNYTIYKDCLSRNVRHSICIYGVEHLPMLATSKSVLANKMIPSFDQAVTSCVSELLLNRTRNGQEIDREYYANINAVRYHRDRKRPGFNIDEFKC